METPKSPKSLYDANVGEIAIKHFFAGFMQGLGGFFVTMISWVVLYYLISQVVLPQMQGLITQAEGLIKSVEKIQGGTTNLMAPTGSKGITIPPEMIQQFQNLQQK